MTWLPSAIYTVSAVKNGDKSQIYISLTWLLIIIDLQYLPQNVCFWCWEILVSQLQVPSSSIKVSMKSVKVPKYKIAANHVQ